MSGDGGGWNKSHELATQYAIEGLRALTLANGGAVVAVLSFAGSAGADRIKPALVAASLMWFVAGLVLALLTMLLAYLAQGAATHDWNRRSTVFEGTATALAFISVVLFAVGAWTAQSGFITAGPKAPPTNAASPYTCETAVSFVRAQADPGAYSARNPKTGTDAVLIRGGWVVLPPCR